MNQMSNMRCMMLNKGEERERLMRKTVKGVIVSREIEWAVQDGKESFICAKSL